MTALYQVEFQDSYLIQTMPDGSQITSPFNLDDINKLEKTCRDYRWNYSKDLSREIGMELFKILNGDSQILIRALEAANEFGECLQMILKAEGSASALPFELLYYNEFLVPLRIHLIRRVSKRGIKRKLATENRSLQILFMACSPLDVYPLLELEKEEDTILDVTKDLPLELDVEDTGALEGLGEKVTTNKYDVIHISGHADIGNNGEPFFLMEDSDGLPVHITPIQLLEVLKLNMPRLLFLSGCRTGETPEHVAAMSFAHQLVAGHVPVVIGWGLPVSDRGARFATEKLYFELSRGKNILDALFMTRCELYKHCPDWSLLRLFSDSTPLDVPLVKMGQKKRPKLRELQYAYLENTQVKVLKKGFIGRRRQIQQGMRCLRKDVEKVGLLLHGTGGLGKSCLAGKFSERFKEHTLIIIHGKLNAFSFRESLKDAFIRGNDDEGLKILSMQEKIPNIIRRLCSSAFQQRNYIILLDDFEKNLERIEEGRPEVNYETVPILEALLKFLPYSGKMTHLIITSRYTFSLLFGGNNLVKNRLTSIGLTSFQEADVRKKVYELDHIANYPNPEIKKKLIEAGRGNPRLMEALNTLVEEVKGEDLDSLLSMVKNIQEEFVQELILNQILLAQPEDFQTFLRHSAVYRLPVLAKGIEALFGDKKYWISHIKKAVQLSLMEIDSTHEDNRYWVTPLIRNNIFGDLKENEKRMCHKAAVLYYQSILSVNYMPHLSAELIEHAIEARQPEIAIEESGDRFLPYLRKSLAYKEALQYGKYVLKHTSLKRKDEKFSKFLFEFGYLNSINGNAKNAIEYYEQALSIAKEVYGEMHPNVATTLNNIGTAFYGLGKYKLAIKYLEQSLFINKEVYGEKHPSMISNLINIGLTWNGFGKHEKAIEYYEQAQSIIKEVHGEMHSDMAACLNAIGTAWADLNEHKKAIEYYEQALSIAKEVYGEMHPNVAATLMNIGTVLSDSGDQKKAIRCYEQAHSINMIVFNEKHPVFARYFNNIGLAWNRLGEHEKAIKCLEQAQSITKELYGEIHPQLAANFINIGSTWKKFGYPKRAKENFQLALDIFQELYGDDNPYTQLAKMWFDSSNLFK